MYKTQNPVEIFLTDSNKETRENMKLFLSATNTELNALACELDTDTYYLQKFLDGHMEVSEALINRINEII